MSAFDLYPREVAEKGERGRPVDLSEGAGFFEGSLTAPVKGAAKGLVVEPARVMNLGLSFAPALVDRMLGSNTRDWWFENMMMRREAEKVAPNPRETGTAGQMLHALFDVGSQAVAGGPLNVLVNKTVGGSIEGVEQGLDTLTAMQKGGIEGGAAALGVALPIAIKPIGSRIPALLQQVGYGVGSNVALGIGQRGLTHEVLAAAGYKDMAEQYKALDEAGLLTDLVLGAAFGGLGHAIQSKGARLPLIRPSDVDAALVKRNAYHLEVDSAPGLARDAETRDAHVDAMLKATDDLIAGRQVDVAEELRAANFEPNGPVDQARARILDEQRQIGKAYDTVLERPLGPSDDPLVRMTPNDIGQVLLERGPTLPPKGEIEVRPGSYGLVKIIWKHGERSAKAAESQVTREDVMRTPEVLGNYEPILDRTHPDGRRGIEWQVERADGKRVVYAVSKFTQTDGQNHVVSVFVNEAKGGKTELSKPKSPESPAVASKAQSSGDTGPGASSSRAGAVGEGPSVAQITDALKREGIEVSEPNVATVRLIAQARALDAAAVDALPDRMPDGEYLAKIKEIIGAKSKPEEAGADRQGAAGAGPRAEAGGAGAGEEGGQAPRQRAGGAEPGGESARAVAQAELADAESIAKQYPDMFVAMDDGTVVSAHEALARADEVIAQAQNDSKAFEAAVMCATRRGG